MLDLSLRDVVLISICTVQVCDMLRDALLNCESENWNLFTEEENSEFIMRIFRHLCLGGSINQFEARDECA